MPLDKIFKNTGGNILVRISSKTGGCGIVEALHLYSNNESGCVIFYWDMYCVDCSYYEPQLKSVSDRLINTRYDDGVLMKVLKYGQKLAEIYLTSKGLDYN